MGSYTDCINQAFKAGKITKAVSNALIEGDDIGKNIDEAIVGLTRQKREAAIQAARMAEAFEKIQSHPDQGYDGLMALLKRDKKGRAAYGNVDFRAKVKQGQYNSRFAEVLSTFRTRRLGFSQDEAGLRKLVAAIYGEAVDDVEIRGFAKQWKELTEFIRKDFNKAGGSIRKNENWLLPQTHNAKAIRKVGLDEWKRRIIGKLDRNQMADDLGNKLTDEQLEKSLDFTYQTITTGGLNKAKDFSVPRMGRKLSRKGSENRFLYFKDSESWLEYQKDFGKGDIFTSLTDWVQTKAHDVALMEALGPNPKETFEALRAQVIKTSGMTEEERAISTAAYRVVSGATNEGELTGVADFFQTTRNVIIASTLKAAFLSSISDIGFQTLTTMHNNIPTVKTLSRAMSLMSPANEADRIFAVKMGLIAEAWMGRAHAANRFADVYGTGASAKLSEGVMRGSWLAPWTDAGAKAFGMEFSSMLADNFHKPLGDLDDAVKRAFNQYGINEADWNKFRATPLLDHKGAKFADMLQDGGEKFHEMILTETDFAVPMPDANVKIITTGGTGRATVAGQSWRSVMMFKSFPITVATTHFYRAAYQSTTGGKLGYTAMLALSTTVLGGLALQAKDVTSGKEARPIDNPEFFIAAFQQGGGIGIFGDFLFSDVNRFGGGITETAFGPTGEAIDAGVKFTLGNVREALKGEETNVLGESAKLLSRYTPGIWQTQLFANALFDQVTLLSDPNAERRFRKMMKRRKKEYGSGYWWKRGKTLPEALR